MSSKLLILLIALTCVFSQEINEPSKNIDYIEVIKCLISNETLVKDINTLIQSIKAQDYTETIMTIQLLFSDGKDALNQCLANDNSPVLNDCLDWCYDTFGPNFGCYDLCRGKRK